uniref:Uncharacterized protein n=1 Tax=Glossina palpalis gambiensis TaxID=67801 RepID=A0A1B0B8C6_9MUSC
MGALLSQFYYLGNNVDGAVAMQRYHLQKAILSSRFSQKKRASFTQRPFESPLCVGRFFKEAAWAISDGGKDNTVTHLQQIVSPARNNVTTVSFILVLCDARQKIQQQLRQQEHRGNEQHEQQEHEHEQQQTLSRDIPAVAALKAAVSNDELSRSTESDSGFDSASGSGTASSGRQIAIKQSNGNNSNKLPTISKMTIEEEIKNQMTETEQTNDGSKHTTVMIAAEPCTTIAKINELTLSTDNSETLDISTAKASSSSSSSSPPIPHQLPLVTTTSSLSTMTNSTSLPPSSTLKRLHRQLQGKSVAEAATDDVNMWANKFLRDLDNLMASDKPITSSSASSSPTSSATSPMLLSAAATAKYTDNGAFNSATLGIINHVSYVTGTSSGSSSHTLNASRVVLLLLTETSCYVATQL